MWSPRGHLITKGLNTCSLASHSTHTGGILMESSTHRLAGSKGGLSTRDGDHLITRVSTCQHSSAAGHVGIVVDMTVSQ